MAVEQQEFEIRIKGLTSVSQLAFIENCVQAMAEHPDSKTVGFTGYHNCAWVDRKPYGFFVRVERTSEEARNRMIEEAKRDQ